MSDLASLASKAAQPPPPAIPPAGAVWFQLVAPPKIAMPGQPAAEIVAQASTLPEIFAAVQATGLQLKPHAVLCTTVLLSRS